MRDEISRFDRAIFSRALRVLFFLTAAYGGVFLWLAPHPPLVDLPQFAGQVTLLKGLLAGTSPWQGLLRVNLLTPYLTSALAALALSGLFPIAVAVKILLSLGYYAFVGGALLLRRKFGGDPRLDWLFLPSYFGFAFVWGFVSFLVASALGLFFILTALHYAEKPALGRGVGLALLGLLLFFSHGLVFLFAISVGGCLLLARFRRTGFQPLAAWPYLVFGGVGLAYAGFAQATELHELAQTALNVTRGRVSWGHPYGLRFFEFFFYTLGSFANKEVLGFAPLLFAAPFLLGLKRGGLGQARMIPFYVLVLFWFAVPDIAMASGFLYQRLAVFALPLFALMFAAPTEAPTPANILRGRILGVVLLLACWGFWGWQSCRFVAFAKESADFEEVLAAAEPGKLALNLVLAPCSAALQDCGAYRHQALWYQAEAGGLVEFNFALFFNQPVHYRRDSLDTALTDENMPPAFDWGKNQGARFDYFFVRKNGALPDGLFAGAPCSLQTVRAVGTWVLLRGCGGR